MEYQVAISPELEVSSAEFVDSWNAMPEFRALASAQLRQATPKGFPIDPEWLNQGLIILSALGGFLGGVALDVLKDVVKEKVTEYLSRSKAKAPAIQVESIRQPDGSYLLVVMEEEA